MKTATTVGCFVALLVLFAPRLSAIGCPRPWQGAEARAIIQGPKLTVPDPYEDMPPEALAYAAGTFESVRDVMSADGSGPGSLKDILAAIDSTDSAIARIDTYYRTTLEDARRREGVLSKECDQKSEKVGIVESDLSDLSLIVECETIDAQLSTLRRNRKNAAMGAPGESELKARREQLFESRPGWGAFFRNKYTTLKLDLADKYGQSNAYTLKTWSAIYNGVHEQWRTLRMDLDSLRAQLAEVRQMIQALETERKCVPRTRDTVEQFYRNVCSRIRLVSRNEPAAKEHPELQAKAQLPSRVAGNTLVFAMEANESWLRKYAIEQLGYWKNIYPEARAVLEYIKANDPNPGYSSRAGECLQRNESVTALAPEGKIQ